MGLEAPPIPKQGVEDSEIYIWVQELLIEEGTQWNSPVVQYLFDSETADLIPNMRISAVAEDRLIWCLTRNGKFSMKSAYNKVFELSLGDTEISLKIPSTDITRKEFWKIETWPRVQHFWWKCLADILPTNVRLSIQCGYINRTCPLCMQHEETTVHVLFMCPFSRAVWMLIPGGPNLIAGSCDNITAIFENWLNLVKQHSLQENCLTTAMIVAWSIWTVRCEVQFENKKASPYTVATKAISFATYITKLNEKKKQKSVTEQENGLAVLPVGAMRKCDGIYGNDLRNGYRKRGNSEQAECLAFLDAVKWCAELQRTHIVLETDLKGIESFINDLQPVISWENENILLDVVDCLRKIPHWECYFVSRNCNKPADRLAKYSRRNRVTSVWFDKLPSIIENALLADDTLSPD
ncbi:uncharacterized protein LOC113360757 [Papaver somniferum]|uniref:uncharacterized protein LOC113360757 n=1 Tax=Papaver somniferum TaxID=3469 RepID=UPI000E6FC218|nr:uncharacterized protein LOC113360757 [Papaver somniferum]